MGKTGRQNARLACAGACENQKRAFGRFDGVALFGVQPIEKIGIRIRYGRAGSGHFRDRWAAIRAGTHGEHIAGIDPNGRGRL